MFLFDFVAMDVLQSTILFKSMVETIIIENNKRRNERLLQIIRKRQQVWKKINLQITNLGI